MPPKIYPGQSVYQLIVQPPNLTTFFPRVCTAHYSLA